MPGKAGEIQYDDSDLDAAEGLAGLAEKGCLESDFGCWLSPGRAQENERGWGWEQQKGRHMGADPTEYERI
jgi:hypothetical protein